MKPIRKDLNKELRELAKQHTANRTRLDWLDKDIHKKLRARSKLESETLAIHNRIKHLQGVMEKARK